MAGDETRSDRYVRRIADYKPVAIIIAVVVVIGAIVHGPAAILDDLKKIRELIKPSEEEIKLQRSILAAFEAGRTTRNWVTLHYNYLNYKNDSAGKAVYLLTKEDEAARDYLPSTTDELKQDLAAVGVSIDFTTLDFRSAFPYPGGINYW